MCVFSKCNQFHYFRGLLSAHVLATALKSEVPALEWYDGELLAMAEDLGRRLLPAFNTSTGIPHGRVSTLNTFNLFIKYKRNVYSQIYPAQNLDQLD